MLLVAGLAFLGACGRGSADCSTVTVQIVNGSSFELPAKTAHCAYVPDAAACCAHEGARCDQLRTPSAFAIVRHPGCS